MRRRGIISSFKWFLPAFPRVEEEGRDRHPVGTTDKRSMQIVLPCWRESGPRPEVRWVRACGPHPPTAWSEGKIMNHGSWMIYDFSNHSGSGSNFGSNLKILPLIKIHNRDASGQDSSMAVRYCSYVINYDFHHWQVQKRLKKLHTFSSRILFFQVNRSVQSRI